MGRFTFDGGLLFWTLVTFTCLVLLLARFTFGPLRNALKAREDAIRGSLEKAERARDEAEQLIAKNEEQLGRAREEARKIIGEGHRIVAEMKREAEDSARRDADLIVSQARDEIDREVQRSLGDLKTTVANLSVRIARQVIKGKLDEAEHEQLADDFIERLKKTHASRRS
jgi:F-type H+-transporting ATPase subunit b